MSDVEIVLGTQWLADKADRRSGTGVTNHGFGGHYQQHSQRNELVSNMFSTKDYFV